MSLNPIKPPTLLPEQVADRLREAIVRGTLRPGERLREATIARQLGVSTIPVREAFRQLEAEGLLASEPRRGRVVRGLSTQDLEDLFRARVALEGLAYEMIHERGGLGPDALAWLADNLAQEQEAIQADNLVLGAELDLCFHDRIYQETGSALLQELWQLLRTRLNLFFYWRWQADPGSTVSRAVGDHRNILDALRRNDLEALRRLSQQVGERVSQGAVQSLRKLQSQVDGRVRTLEPSTTEILAHGRD